MIDRARAYPHGIYVCAVGRAMDDYFIYRYVIAIKFDISKKNTKNGNVENALIIIIIIIRPIYSMRDDWRPRLETRPFRRH